MSKGRAMGTSIAFILCRKIPAPGIARKERASSNAAGVSFMENYFIFVRGCKGSLFPQKMNSPLLQSFNVFV